VSTAITGASKPEQVTENMKAAEVVAGLDTKAMERIDEILGNKPEEDEE
jgi:aryl-alcohol dehydrogenase-like predicted oxidoreductase